MKILWQLPEKYWVGATGICAVCGARFELEDGDTVPQPAGFEQNDDQRDKGILLRLIIECPVCQEDVYFLHRIS